MSQHNEEMEPIIKNYTNVTDPPFEFDEKTHSRKATVAEKVGIEGRDDLYRMFNMGGLIRTIDAEIDLGGKEKLFELRDMVQLELQEYDNYLHDNYIVIQHPIRNLVGMSLGSLLHSVEYVKSKTLWY